MALVGGACEGIATRDQWSKMCNCSPGTIVLCTDSSAALGFVKRKGASPRTRHVDTNVYFMQAWAMELGQGILKVHGDSQQVADCLMKIMTRQAARRRAMTGVLGGAVVPSFFCAGASFSSSFFWVLSTSSTFGIRVFCNHC